MVFSDVGFSFFSFLRSFGRVEGGEVRFVMGFVGLNCSINRVWFAGIGF